MISTEILRGYPFFGFMEDNDTNRLYAELVKAARETHNRLAAVHVGKTAPFAERNGRFLFFR